MVAARDVKSVRTGARNSTAGDDKSMVFAVTFVHLVNHVYTIIDESFFFSRVG